MDKEKIRQALLEKMETERDKLKRSYESRKKAAIDAPGPMHARFDTTRQEQSALSSALANELNEIDRAITALRRLPLRKSREVEGGAIVRVRENSKITDYFLVPKGAGNYLLEQFEVQTVAFSAPLGKAISFKKPGEEVKFETPGGATRQIKILSVE